MAKIKSMKLFVWDHEDVLRDYRSGIIVAMARDLEEARKSVIANAEDWVHADLWAAMGTPPKVYEQPFGVYRWGGS